MTLMSAQIHFVVSIIVDGCSLERMVHTGAIFSNAVKGQISSSNDDRHRSRLTRNEHLGCSTEPGPYPVGAIPTVLAINSSITVPNIDRQ